MSNVDHGMLQAQFDAVAKALAHEIKKALATPSVDPARSTDGSLTEEEGQLLAVRSREAPPEIARLIAHLREIGAEMRARDLLPTGAETLS
jgi:hypothetical protein